MTRELLLQRMKELAALKHGDMMPRWLCDKNPSCWADALSEIFQAAIDEIEKPSTSSGYKPLDWNDIGRY